VVVEVIRFCERCNDKFKANNKQIYCSPCKKAMLARVCKQCGDTFDAPSLSAPGIYCGDDCRMVALRAVGTRAQAKVRRDRGRVNVQCALVGSGCPTPNDMISVRRSVHTRDDRTHLHFHPACYTVYKAQGAGLRKRTTVPCSLAECGKPVERTSGQLAHTAHVFCSREHWVAWQRRDYVTVRCTLCKGATVFGSRPRQIPQTVDRTTLTWQCPECRPRIRGRYADEVKGTTTDAPCTYCNQPSVKIWRPLGARPFCSPDHKRAWQHEHGRRFVTAVCAYCQIEAQAGKRSHSDVTFPIRRTYFKRSRIHFCDKSHRASYYHEQRRRTRRCRHCNETIERREKGATFCDNECYHAWRAGRTVGNPRAADADRRIQAAWDAGVRGVRALTRESHSGVNTVRKWLGVRTAVSS